MSRETTPTENVVAELRKPAPKFGLEEFDPTYDIRQIAAALIESQRALIERVERERDRLVVERDGAGRAYVEQMLVRETAEARATALEAEIARLRVALEWYAGDGSTYDGIDVGQRARQALSRSTEKNDGA